MDKEQARKELTKIVDLADEIKDGYTSDKYTNIGLLNLSSMLGKYIMKKLDTLKEILRSLE